MSSRVIRSLMQPTASPRGLSGMYLCCYDRENNVTLVVVEQKTWAYRYKMAQ